MRFPEDMVEQILNHMQGNLQEERCGLIGGVNGEARLFLPITNILHSPTRFRMDVSEQWQAFQTFEAQGLELMAIVHSHPNGPSVPSPTDLAEFAYPGVLYLIAAPTAEGWQLRGFWLDEGQIREEGLEISRNASS